MTPVPEITEQWAQAVENESNVLGKGFLCRRQGGVPHWCPLGLLCDLAVRSGVIQPGHWTGFDGILEFMLFDGEQGILPKSVASWAGIRQCPSVHPNMADRVKWRLPLRYMVNLPGSGRGADDGRLAAVPIAAISDYATISRAELADVIRSL